MGFTPEAHNIIIVAHLYSTCIGPVSGGSHFFIFPPISHASNTFTWPSASISLLNTALRFKIQPQNPPPSSHIADNGSFWLQENDHERRKEHLSRGESIIYMGGKDKKWGELNIGHKPWKRQVFSFKNDFQRVSCLEAKRRKWCRRDGQNNNKYARIYNTTGLKNLYSGVFPFNLKRMTSFWPYNLVERL